MAQKLFAPFKKINHQVQKVPFIKKAMDIRHQKMRSDVFGCHLSSTFGYPDQPSALAYDSTLKLIAIGTHRGDLKILGGPGVEFHAVHSNGDEVSRIVFIPNEGRLITLTADNKLHLWEFDDVATPPVWAETKMLDLSDKEGCRVTCLCLNHDGSKLYFGTENSLLQEIDVKEWKLREGSLLQEGEELHDKLGEMISLEMHPIRNLLLAGFSKGTTLIIDITTVNPPPPEVEPETTECKSEEKSEEVQPAAEAPEEEAPKKDAPEDESAPATEGEEKKTEEPAAESVEEPAATPAEEKKAEEPVPETAPPKVVHYATKTHVCAGHQSLEYASWMCDHEFVASYGDGSFLTWKVDLDVPDLKVSNQTPPTTPYGPFPCKSINKVMIKNTGSGAMTIFSGGMPKATHGEKHTVSVLGHNCSTDLANHVSDHVCFEFSSQVIDFVTIDSITSPTAPPADDSHDDHHHVDHTAEHVVSKISALLVILEHEMVAIDLLTPDWPLFKLPYLSSINSSCVTAVNHAENIPKKVIELLKNHQEPDSTCSQLPWPVCGGLVKETPSGKFHDLLITGHEDGSVSLWDLNSGDVFSRLATIKTAPLYVMDNQETQAKSGDDDAWPPFRRVGSFIPIADEARLVVTRVALVCQPDSENAALIVGGMSGQASVWTLSAEPRDVEVDVIKVVADVIEDRNAYVWKSPEALKVHEGERHFKPGFQPDTLVQIEPAAEITALAYQPHWQLLALGGAHGFVVVDTLQKKPVHSNATVFATHEVQPDSLMSKSKQLQKSLRQSFKRFKKMVPKPSTPSKTPKSKDAAPAATNEEQKPGTSEDKKEDAPAAETPKKEGDAEAAAGAAAPEETPASEIAPAEDAKKEESTSNEAHEEKTGEKAAAAESAENQAAGGDATADVATPLKEPVSLTSGDVSTALIRCLLFTETFIVSPHERVPSLWVGSQAGSIYIHNLVLKRDSDNMSVEVHLNKELILQHKAPVVGLSVVDAKTRAPVKVTPLTPKVEAKPESPAPGTTPPAVGEPATTEGETAAPAEPAATETPPAAPAPASAPPTPSHSSAVEHHELVVCSEEQVKIFSLPKLKAKHKYKVLSDKSVTVGADAAPGDIEAQTGTIERSQLTKTCTIDRACLDGGSAARHRIKSFGVQLFKHGEKEEWNVVVALADSLFYILSLPAMKKQMNGSFATDKDGFLPLTYIGSNDATVILNLSGMGQVRVTDVSQHFPTRYGANCTIPLPEGVRPKRQEEAPPTPTVVVDTPETPANTEIESAENVETKPDAAVTELDKAATVNDDEDALESLAKETVENTLEEAKKEAVDILVVSDKTVDQAIKEAISELEQLDYAQTDDTMEEGGDQSDKFNHLNDSAAVPEITLSVNNSTTKCDDGLAAPPSSSGDAATADGKENAVDDVTEKLDNVQLDGGDKDTSAQHVGDITMDCIKDYANNDESIKSETCNDDATPTKPIVDDDDDLKKPAVNETPQEPEATTA